MSELVVNGAVLMCTAGSTPSSLSVTSQSKTKCSGSKVGTINDNSVSNIGTFGICSILTAQAGGTPTPCSPSIASVWTPGAIKVKCSNNKCLLKSDTLLCTVGGTISITNAGQTKVQGM